MATSQSKSRAEAAIDGKGSHGTAVGVPSMRFVSVVWAGNEARSGRNGRFLQFPAL
jgi:hypothetical protein